MDTSLFTYPAPAFAFALTIVPTLGAGGVVGLPADAAFSEAQGIDPHVAVEEIKEGGVNTHVHQVPGVTKHGNLVLKRGFVSPPSGFGIWASQTVGSTLGSPIQTQAILLSLLGADALPTVAWTFLDCWPVKWEVGGFDARRNEVLIEKLELSYSTVTRIPGLLPA